MGRRFASFGGGCCGRSSRALCRSGIAVAVRQLAWWGSSIGRCATAGRGASWSPSGRTPALIVWMAASVVLALSDPDGTWGLSLRVVATVALGWWAVDEVVRGVNPWRRLLGVVVFAGLLVSLLR